MAKYLDNTGDYVRDGRPEEDPVRLTATEARQGFLGRPVLYVLIVGIILAFIAWWGAEYFGVSIAPPSQTTDQTTTSSTTTDPAADPKVIDNNQPAGQPVEKTPAIQDSTKL